MKQDRETQLKFDEKTASLFWRQSGNKEFSKVYPVPCFPISQPLMAVALNDENGNELALINPHKYLKKNEFDILQKFLQPALFCKQIERIYAIDRKNELRRWILGCSGKKVEIFTAHEYWPQVINKTEILIEDVFQVLYKVKNINKLDKQSKKLLQSFVEF